jgi:ATPase subunit of ABC transporter with duplicated ATPase domains
MADGPRRSAERRAYPGLGLTVSLLAARGVSFSYGAATVLTDVELTVAAGDRTALVGPNGAGKSTLLRLLAGLEQPDSGEITVAGTVGLLPQERDRRPGETVLGYVARRTGVSAAESALQSAAEDMASGGPGDAGSAYAKALDRYLALGGPDLEARTAEVSAALGLPADLDRRTSGLSGGQAARLALASVLLARFDVILLDEPTNDLDLAGLELLERHLAGLRGGLVVVSHDRAFLEQAASEVIQLDQHSHQAIRYGGGFAAYQAELERDRARARAEYEAYAGRRDELIQRARRQREWSRSGERSANSPAARRREPDKNIRHARAQGAQQLGAGAAAAIRAADRLEVVQEPRKEWELRLRLGAARRSGDVVATLDGAVVDRGSFRLGPVDLQLAWADRVVVAGTNGSGKTTLIEAILGRIPLTAGRRSLGPSVVVGEIDQARRTFDPASPLLDAFCAHTGQIPGEARTLLAKFGLGADDVLRPAGSLSPGERTRADLALLARAGANLLVLDEPTNHLDLPAIEQLEQALERYDGTLLMVTHDRRLRERIPVTRHITVIDGKLTET